MAKRGVYWKAKKLTNPRQAEKHLMEIIADVNKLDKTFRNRKTATLYIKGGGATGLALSMPSAKFDLSAWLESIKKLEALIRNPLRLKQLAVQAYSETVSTAIRAKWAASGMDILDQGGKKSSKPGRPPGQLSALYRRISRMMYDPRFLVSKATSAKVSVGLPPLSAFTSIVIPDTTSPFRSVFYMTELGTGIYAKPRIRSFASYSTTPYKVPPGFVQAKPGMWFSKPEIARKAKAYLQSLGGSEAKAARVRAGITKSGKVPEAIRYYKTFHRVPPHFSKGRVADTPEDLMYKGRRGKFVLLDHRGVVSGYRGALAAARQLFIEYVNMEIQKVGHGRVSTFSLKAASGLASTVLGRVGFTM